MVAVSVLIVLGGGAYALRNVHRVPEAEVEQTDVSDVFAPEDDREMSPSEEGSAPIHAPEISEPSKMVTLTPTEEQTPVPATSPVVPPSSVAVRERSGVFVGSAGHDVQGEAAIYTKDGNHALRFEDFSVVPGPDYFVYLSKDDVSKVGFDPSRAVSLGKIKASEGEQTYTVPENFSEYSHVVIWCRLFSVLIAEANLVR